MANFSKQSRYTRYGQVYQAQDRRRGGNVLAVLPPHIPERRNRGAHLVKQGQRLDHIAWHYLKDAEGYWILTGHNARILPDAVLSQYRIRIPLKSD